MRGCRVRCLGATLLLLAGVGIGAAAGAPVRAKPVLAEAKTSVEWFQRASDQVNLRLPGAAAFQMTVKFHGYPGEEFLGVGQKPEIVTGEGVYKETWVAPHQWRREVTFGSYHAVEIESDKGRKMQASSDYEPSRDLMLLGAVLDPIPRNFSSKEFRREGASGWHIDRVTVGSATVVRINKGSGDERGQTNDSYYFLPQGLLLMRNLLGLTTSWSDDAVYNEKVYSRKISIKAGDREILSADVAVEPVGSLSSDKFDLPGGLAAPGMTLRKIEGYEAKFDLSFNPSWDSGTGESAPQGASIWSVRDRTGHYREVEAILTGRGDIGVVMDLLRRQKARPATIDGSACELMIGWGWP